MRRMPDEAVLTAIVTTLRASTGVMALVQGVFNNVPQNQAYPYIEVTIPSAARQDTFGRLGAATIVDVKAIGQGFGDQEGVRIRDQVTRALDMQKPTASGHSVLGIAWDGSTKYDELIGAVRTRYHVASFRVWTEQSSS